MESYYEFTIKDWYNNEVIVQSPICESIERGSLVRLWTIDELERNSIACLGNMEQHSFQECVEKMSAAALVAGIVEPIMGIALHFKKNIADVERQICEVKDERWWDLMKRDAVETCVSTPRVFVVDGNRFLFPI